MLESDWIAPTIGAGASLLGGILGMVNQNNVNSWQEQQAQKFFDLTAQREDTAYQRTARDMTLAGINPLYKQMQPVSINGGTAPNAVMQQLAPYANSFADAVTSGANIAETARHNRAEEEKQQRELLIEWEKMMDNFKTSEETRKKIQAEIAHLEADEFKKYQEVYLIWEQMDTEQQKALNLIADTALKEAQKGQALKTIEELTQRINNLQTEDLKTLQEIENLCMENNYTQEQIAKIKADLLLARDEHELNKIKEEHKMDNAFWDRLVKIGLGVGGLFLGRPIVFEETKETTTYDSKGNKKGSTTTTTNRK